MATAQASKVDLAGLSALQARDRLQRGEFSAEDLTGAALARIAEREEAVGAWVYLDPEHALAQARALDAWRKSGRPTGPLHGIPIGVKDIVDTRDMPTENGTPLDAGRRPTEDAAVVQRLRAAGAVILGKTVTTELAVFTPGKTRNPQDAGRTPGGSSSGSAAAVAAGMVPLAIGSQTNGSVIRPASFCGVVGYKPSRGLVSRHGVLAQSPALDTIGTFSRTVEDAALLVDAIAGHDPRDRQSELAAHPDLLAAARSRPPVRPALAFVRTPAWDQAGDDVKAGFQEVCGALGAAVETVDLPKPFERVHAMHAAINLTDIARNYARYYSRGPESLSPRLAGMVEEGRTVLAIDYAVALDWIGVMNATLEKLFERFDAIITPAAPGEAPTGLASTGNPVFSTIWTYCGVPAITLPLLIGGSGLPVGVQVVGRRMYDGRLLRTARWLEQTLLDAPDGAEESGAGGAG